MVIKVLKVYVSSCVYAFLCVYILIMCVCIYACIVVFVARWYRLPSQSKHPIITSIIRLNKSTFWVCLKMEDKIYQVETSSRSHSKQNFQHKFKFPKIEIEKLLQLSM